MKHFCTYFILLVILSSCINDKIEDTITKNIMVNLVLSVEDNRNTIKTFDTEINTTTSGDYTISRENLIILIYDNNGNFRDKAVTANIIPTNEYNKYIITGIFNSFTEEDINNNFKIIVIVNTLGNYCPVTIPNTIPTKESELYKNCMFKYKNGYNLSHAIISSNKTDGIIPMWGKAMLKLQEENNIEISMLRALSKIEISASPESGILIDSIKITTANNIGYITPKNAAENSGTQRADITNINIPSNTIKTDKIKFCKHNNKFYLYVPEQYADDSEIEVYVGNNTYTIYIGDYSNKTKLPLIRNYNYIYNITDLNTSSPLQNLKQTI